MAIDEAELKILLKALAFAAHKHKDQRRRDVAASPYINHPISLADILCNEAHVSVSSTVSCSNAAQMVSISVTWASLHRISASEIG